VKQTCWLKLHKCRVAFLNGMNAFKHMFQSKESGNENRRIVTQLIGIVPRLPQTLHVLESLLWRKSQIIIKSVENERQPLAGVETELVKLDRDRRTRSPESQLSQGRAAGAVVLGISAQVK